MAVPITHTPAQMIWVWAVQRLLQQLSGVLYLIEKSSTRTKHSIRYLVAIKVRFNFKVNSDPKRLAFAAQVKKKKLCKVFIKASLPYSSFLNFSISNDVSFLSPFDLEEKPLYCRGPYFIMGKNHAARETTCVFIFVWFLQKKTKDLHKLPVILSVC